MWPEMSRSQLGMGLELKKGMYDENNCAVVAENSSKIAIIEPLTIPRSYLRF